MNRLRFHRLARGVSQARLAERAGISRQALHAIENGADPAVSVALALVAVLNDERDNSYRSPFRHLTVEAIFGRESKMKRQDELGVNPLIKEQVNELIKQAEAGLANPNTKGFQFSKQGMVVHTTELTNQIWDAVANEARAAGYQVTNTLEVLHIAKT